MPTQIEKLEAHASHLLDAFIQLCQRYAMLDPMLFDKTVIANHGSGKRARGFNVLKQSLFLSCAQDIAKLTLDDDPRTPSLKNNIGALTNGALRHALREQFAIWKTPLAEDETDPEVLEALGRMELREQAQRRAQFDELYREATAALLAALSTSSTTSSLTSEHQASNGATSKQPSNRCNDRWRLSGCLSVTPPSLGTCSTTS